MTEKLEAFQIPIAAVLIGAPLASAEAGIQHCRNGVGAKRVDMVFIHPEKRRSYQKVGNFGSAQIERLGAPLGIFGAQGVGVLVQRRAVEIGKRKLVLGEVRGHPIQYYANTVPVHIVDKIHKVLRGAVARRGAEVARYLISPAGVERILAYAHYFNVGIAHIQHVFAQLVRKAAVVQKLVLVPPHFRILFPTAEVHLVHSHRLGKVVFALLCLEILAVPPLVVREVCNDRGVCGALFAAELIGVDFIHLASVGAHD